MDTKNNSTLQTPDPEPVTPSQIQPTTNGVLRRHPPIHVYHFRHPLVLSYRECLKNHVAPNGGHVFDGCGEFLPAPTSNLQVAKSLYCDVCGCHRNFHRRDEEYYFPGNLVARNKHVHTARHTLESSSESPLPISSSAPHMLMALNQGQREGFGNPNMVSVGVSRKRFRTKFTPDQKGKMLELAEKVGWKMQKMNDGVIDESCKDIGVEKGVFKVWMHNNKNIVGGKKKTFDNSILVAPIATPPIMMIENGVGSDEANCIGFDEGALANGECVEQNVVDGTNDAQA